MKNLLYSFLFLLSINCISQVGINTVTPDASLDIEVNNPIIPLANDGLLIPRLNNFPAINPGVEQNSMLVYLNNNLINVNISGVPQDYNIGFYFWSNAQNNWISFSIEGDDWRLVGNSNVTSTSFLGSTNDESVQFRANNRFIGRLHEDGGVSFGRRSEATALRSAAYGEDATAASNSIALGAGSSSDQVSIALGLNASSTVNSTAIGQNATNIGSNSIAIGNNPSSGDNAIAIGNNAENSGGNSIAMGVNTVSSFGSIVMGGDAISSSNNSIVIGNRAESSNPTTITIGESSITGAFAGNNNAIAIGRDSNAATSNSVALGRNAEASGNNSIAIGRDAIASNTSSVAIGRGAITSQNNQIVLGNAGINEIGGAVNFSVISDARFKYDIKENVPGIDFISRIKPVTYKLDRNKIARFKNEKTTDQNQNTDEVFTGFLAQQIDEVVTDLKYNFNGVRRPSDLSKEHYSVRYSSFVVPLVKTAQEQQEIIEAQSEKIEIQSEKIKSLEERLEKLEELMNKK